MARGAVVAKWAACTAAAVTCLLASTAMMSWKKEGRLELLARAAPRSMLRQQRLWLGENWRIKGLQDDGKYMVPEDPQPETSGNSLFDFGLENGLPIDPESGEPVAGRTEYYARTGTSESHFPREVNQFNIDSIRSNEDGYLPWWYYDDSYPTYTSQWGFMVAPKVGVEDGHITSIEDNSLKFYDNF